ncbi:MAG TPA: NADH-quinone oxidoreductase subunit M [Polyangiaceae bacterium]|nr:NADH-quinone oxidoreductase subunit M [Polyangiaceae bacterium]
MHEYAGPLQRVVLSRTLWVMVALPLLGVAWHVVLWRRRAAVAGGGGPTQAQLTGARTVGLGTAVVTAAAVVGHVISLLRLDAATRAMLDPVARGVALGGLEAPLALWMDGTSAVECTLASAVALGAAVVLAMRPAARRGWREWAWLHLALAGAMLSFLADGFAGLALGWSLSAAAAAWLAGWSSARAAAVAASRGALAVACMTLGAVLLFWALGGDWDADDYGADAPDGIAAVHLESRGGASSVTMTAPGGALTYVDDSRVPLARVPFVRAALPQGSHVVRVVTGARDEEAARVTLGEGDEAVLVPLGPTLAMHTMREELAVRDAHGDAPVRQALEQRVAPGGVAVVAAALLLFLGAAAAMNNARSPVGAPGPLVAVAASVMPAMLGPALLLRLEPLFPSARHTGTVVAAVGAAMVLGAAWQALAHEGIARWLVFTLGAPGGLACAALGMGGGARGLAVIAVLGAATAALHLLAVRRSDVPIASDDAQEESALVSLPERFGALIASMERWVVGAVATAVAAAAALAAWMVATADRHVVSTPGDRVAARVARAGRRVQPLVGMPLGRFVWAILAALAVLLVCSVARAAPGMHSSGRIVLSLPGGVQGPLELAPGQGGWVGTVTVTNVGTEPLIVSRVAIRGDEDDVRSPARVAVRFAEGAATSATLAPGAAKDLVVSWMPDRDPRVRQAFGHVVVTSTDEEAGEVAMGFRVQAPTGLGWLGAHALSLLVGLPLLVVLAAGVARSTGRRDAPIVARTALAVAVVEVLLALWTYARFVPDVGRADGNDGFQFVERAVWVRSVGAEWYVGLDGVSAALVPLAAVLWLVAIVVARVDRRGDAYAASLALLASAVTAALVALDLAVLFAAWQLVLVALVMLVGGWGGARAEHAAAKIATYGALGSASLLGAFVALSRASGPTFLVDGTAAAHTLAIPELARTTFAAQAPIAGIPFVDVAWLLLFVGVAVATPVVPLHGWLPEALEEAPAGAGIMLAGVVTSLGPYLLVRVGLAAMPEGARWAGASIAALGVLSTAYAGLCAMAQHDLRRFVAYATIATGGSALLGIGAFTAQGLAGAVAALFARGLAAAMLLGVAAALAQRVRTCALDRFGGLATETPALAVLAAAGLATSLGVPCLAGFWGPLLAMLGSFARHPVLATVFAVALVATAAAHLRAARLLLLGHVDPAWRRSTYLEPFGGRLPDAAPREAAALIPLAIIALLIGLWPTPLLASMAAGARDVTETVQPPTSSGAAAP